MKSYDIDGVLTVGVRPNKPCVIVSGRLAAFMPETRRQLAEMGIDADIPVYLRPGGEPADRVGAGVWKATIINWARVEEHYEDDPLQANIIAAMCRVRIVMVATEREVTDEGSKNGGGWGGGGVYGGWSKAGDEVPE